MPVAVVRIGEVMVAVYYRRMNVFMGVRFRAAVRRVVEMLVVRIVHVTMAVLQAFVGMVVGVAFADVQPHADSHERGRRPERQTRRFTQQGKRQQRTGKWRNREIRAGACRTQLA